MTSYVMESSLQHASAGILKEKASQPSSTASTSELHNYSSLSPAHHTVQNRVKNQSRPARLSTPELSVVSEDGESTQVVLGIDAHTGLPKLAVELLPEMEAEVQAMGHRISSCSDSSSKAATSGSSGTTSGGGQSKRERKSVTFDPISDIKRQRSMSDSKVSPTARLSVCVRER